MAHNDSQAASSAKFGGTRLDPVGLGIIGAIGILVVTGWVSTWRSIGSLDQVRQRATEFLALLKRYYESGGHDTEAYTQLVYQSPRLQTDLGPLGVMAYKPPGANYFIQNYQLVVNLLPEIKHWVTDDDLFRTIRPGLQAAETIQEAILRHLGVRDEWQTRLHSRLRNPAALLAQGMRLALFSPFGLLSALGVLSQSFTVRLRTSAIAGFVSGVVSLLFIISAVVSLVAGWATFVAIVRRWLGI